MSILVVDDSPVDRALLLSILEGGGYTDLIAVRSADEAFYLLGLYDEKVPEVATRIELILLDVMMPGLDGVAACSRIKSLERFQDLPIVMVTARTEAEDLQLGFAAGAVDYIRKPINRVELLARVRSALRLNFEMARRQAREKELVEMTRQLKEANQTLQRLSSMDGLTGIANRRRFDEFFNQEWRRAARDSTLLSLLLVDIDCFKAYNDCYGHKAGDNALKEVADTLSKNLRRPADFVARYGGEEFVVVLPNTHSEGAMVVGESQRIAVESLALTHEHSNVAACVTISVGAATTVPDRNTARAVLFGAADRALYQAKQTGRNRVCAAAAADLKE